MTVNESNGPGAAAINTVNVVAVNNDPVTVYDSIVTNVVGVDIVVPEWALLANDEDPDGAPLDIYLAHGAAGLTGLSLTTNPGSVTFTDGATAGGSFVYEATDGFSPDSWNDALVSVTRLSSNVQLADNFNGTATVLSAANNSTGTTLWATSWKEANDDANIRGGQIQIDGGAAPGTGQLRFGLGDGGSISRGINLSGASNATMTLAFDKNNIDVGESVQVQFAADGVNFVTLNTITNTDGTVDSGNAQGFLTLALTGALSTNSAIRFLGTGLSTAGEDIRIDNVTIAYGAPSTTVTAAAGNQILIGNDIGSTFTGGTGDDIVFANGGDDIITWWVGDGRDFIDGGSNEATGDRLLIYGDGTAEDYVIYARAEAIAAGITGLNDATEIVITRNGIANVIAELDNVEKFTIDTAGGVDTVAQVGDFGPTSLLLNTIAVNEGATNEAPGAVNDSVVTNIRTGEIVVPEWALLANDSDPEGAALDMISVDFVGLTGVSLATNPGAVTFHDDAINGGALYYEVTDGQAVDGISEARVGVTRLQTNAQVADNFNGTATVLSAANNSTGTTLWATSWTETNDDANIRGGQIQIDGGAAPGTGQLRFGLGDGGSISRGINLSGASNATMTLAFDKNNIDVGESVQVQFAADGVNFVTLNTLTNTEGTIESGNAQGNLTLALTGALSANSTIRFLGTGLNTVGEDIRIDNLVITYSAPSTTVTAAAGNQILIGNDVGSTFTGGTGDDIVFANGGDDIITWWVGHGRDFIDGGSNEATGDRVVIYGDGTAEDYVVYARAEAIAAGVTGLNEATEIVITRNGIADVIAELDNVEEITINTADGADAVRAVGDFVPTSLFFHTITVNGGEGRDTIDASQLTSAHQLVLQSSVEERMQTAVIPGAEEAGRAAWSSIARKSMFDVEDINFGPHGWRHQVSFANEPAIGTHNNSTYLEVHTHEMELLDFGLISQTDDSAMRLDSADYLLM